jgi:hypothetical protein
MPSLVACNELVHEALVKGVNVQLDLGEGPRHPLKALETAPSPHPSGDLFKRDEATTSPSLFADTFFQPSFAVQPIYRSGERFKEFGSG